MVTESNSNSPPLSAIANVEDESRLDLASDKIRFRRKLRHLYDRSANILIAAGGIGVIVAILLIFLYLFYEVIPLFGGAEFHEGSQLQVSTGDSGQALHLAIEEQAEIAMRLDNAGNIVFFGMEDGALVSQVALDIPADFTISTFALDTESNGVFSLGSTDGRAIVASYTYETTFSPVDNQRIITPAIEYPFGDDAFTLFEGASLSAMALRSSDDTLLLSGTNEEGAISLLRISQQQSLLSAFGLGGNSGGNIEVETAQIDVVSVNTQQMFIDADQRWLFVIGENGLARLMDVRAGFNGVVDNFEIEAFITENAVQHTAVRFLLGGISLLVADESGTVAQWFLVRAEEGFSLEKIREFSLADRPIVALSPEQRRKNFVAADDAGNFAIFNTTSNRKVIESRLSDSAPANFAISPRGDALLVEWPDGNFQTWEVENEHPEVSWGALWNKVWYESYAEPEYIWQSSASTNEFEPKYSLVPLSFGTLKAAFYAMLLAAPLAICGAIFTGYFMAPAMRRKVKPLVELMEALPTVVLGFLAGLWLAPFVENNLLGIFSMLIILPISILLASLVWIQLPRNFRHSIPEGWEAAILIPVILIFGYFSFVIAGPLENIFFDGDLRIYLTNDLGISYDQRNALVVGFAMGFAVIPTIFSIAEDAIFTVPKQLTYGSLALGATPWQSLYRVVLPTASPGIFSALMIGLGRAVGETMIVLMATGNTPIMDANIFEGMRTLAANIAVEIPESEVDSTHYRILFLAALVLFMFTFVFNTLAEIIRQRLRTKYSTI